MECVSPPYLWLISENWEIWGQYPHSFHHIIPQEVQKYLWLLYLQRNLGNKRTKASYIWNIYSGVNVSKIQVLSSIRTAEIEAINFKHE